MGWVSHFDNNDWEIDPETAVGSWSGSDWDSGDYLGSFEVLSLSVIGTWADSYRPTKFRITFTGATDIAFGLVDIDGETIAEEGVPGEYLYQSGEEITTDFVTYGLDLFVLFIIAADGDTFTVTNIEFEEAGSSGDVCWGDDNPTQINVRDFAGNITAGADYRIVGTGDGEKVELGANGYIELETWNLGAMLCQITRDQYESGSGGITIKYKDGSTESACDADSWHVFSAPFACSGWIKVRIEAV